MSGLVSKWAVQKELIEEANEQDNTVKKTKSATTFKKSQPLESKWASPSKPDMEAPAQDQQNRTKSNGRKNKYPGSPRGNLLTPPLSADPDISTHSEKGRRQHENHFRSPQGRAKHKSGRRYDSRGSIRDDNKVIEKADLDEDQDKIPMSDAAKSFASRLGMDGRSPRAKTFDKDGFVSTDEEVSDEEPSHEAEEQGVSDEELQPMTNAAKSLASRLGIVSLDDLANNGSEKKKPFKVPRERNVSSRASGSRNMNRSESKQTFQKGLKNALKEAKLKQEVQEMLDKLGDSSRSWADLEDE